MVDTGATSFSMTTALHSYFTVRDIAKTELKGIQGIYKDKTQDWKKLNTPSPYAFNRETDRIHLYKPQSVSIEQKDCSTEIASAGHDSLVVWNPWAELSKSMGDMAEDGYLTMLCVETAVTEKTEIKPGQAHVLTQIVS